MTTASPPPRPLRLVRGSHIVLPMPNPPQTDAHTLQDEDERVIFVIPWLDGRFLIVGTTDLPHLGDPGTATCSAEEKAYLLGAYNRYLVGPAGVATSQDVVFTWSGVRALHDDEAAKPSAVSRSAALSSTATWHRRLCQPLWRQTHHPPRLGRDGARSADEARRQNRSAVDQRRDPLWRRSLVRGVNRPRRAGPRKHCVKRRAGASLSPMATGSKRCSRGLPAILLPLPRSHPE